MHGESLASQSFHVLTEIFCIKWYRYASTLPGGVAADGEDQLLLILRRFECCTADETVEALSEEVAVFAAGSCSSRTKAIDVFKWTPCCSHFRQRKRYASELKSPEWPPSSQYVEAEDVNLRYFA